MKKKGSIIAYIFLILVFLAFLIPFCLNEFFIYKYNKGDYNRNLGKSLLVIGFTEKYIGHYNYGNLLYQIGYYEDAIKEYEKSLEKGPSEDRVCSVRINLTLSIVATISDEMDCDEKLETIQRAKDALFQDDCAYEGNNYGKSEEAKELAVELSILEEEITKSCEQGQSGGDSGDDPSSGDDSEEEEKKREEEEKKSEELEERNEGASGSRQDELDQMEGYDNYSYYDGKKW